MAVFIDSFSQLQDFIDDVVQRLKKDVSEISADSELQKHISCVMQGFLKADSIAGNGGREVIETFGQVWNNLRPAKEHQTLDEYLEFRHRNIAAKLVLDPE